MILSGWCSSWGGARPQCDRCPSSRCQHECHDRLMVERDSRSAGGRIRAQVKTAPGGALTPDSQGLADERSVD